ncbi:AAA family ATPase [Vagococcus sp.]|uniref:AAA family ATPase n=1 Tax=Vagococcus sp. TaxID=1933889 RepID=UPI002FC882FA
MVKVLLTGMSGVGKSTTLKQICQNYEHVIDLDYDGWIFMDEENNELKIDTNRIVDYLLQNKAKDIFLAGTAINQREMYPYLDFVITLTAPLEVMHERVLTRNNKSFGKSSEEWQKIISDKNNFEPLIIKGSDFVVSTDSAPADVVKNIYKLVGLIK